MHFTFHMRWVSTVTWVFSFLAISLQAADGSKVFDVRQFGAKAMAGHSTPPPFKKPWRLVAGPVAPP